MAVFSSYEVVVDRLVNNMDARGCCMSRSVVGRVEFPFPHVGGRMKTILNMAPSFRVQKFVHAVALRGYNLPPISV